MNKAFERVAELGVLPVVTLTNADRAASLADALCRGGLPVMEITMRTPEARECLRRVREAHPEMCVGAGTVLTTQQVDAAMEAGAEFVVSPGYNPRTVEYCFKRGMPILPGCTTAAELEIGLEAGLDAFKFFPSEPNGGVSALTYLHAPFAKAHFLPAGGVTMQNMAEYLRKPFVFAVGGGFMARGEDIESERWERIEENCRQSVTLSLGFELAHVGVNHGDGARALEAARELSALFRLPVREGRSSAFSGAAVEHMKGEGYGEAGHIGFYTNSVPRALAYYRRMGVAIREESVRRDAEGNPASFYFERELGGFALHIVGRG